MAKRLLFKKQLEIWVSIFDRCHFNLKKGNLVTFFNVPSSLYTYCSLNVFTSVCLGLRVANKFPQNEF